MIEGGFGGAKTKTGLNFENTKDLLVALSKIPGYQIKGDEIFFNGELIATRYKKNNLYTKLLHPNDVEWIKIISKRLLPDDAILNHKTKTIYILELKFQKVAGSVDEKLQTCDFKKKQYTKLLASLKYKVEYIYFLSDWFQHDSYKDVREYIKESGCHFFFGKLPLEAIGLDNDQKN